MPKKTALQPPSAPDRGQPPEVIRAPQAAEQEGIRAIRTPDFATTYANHGGITLSPWDFCLRFGKLQVREGEVLAAEEIGIYMSPQHTKAFLEVLVQQISRSEQMFGTIPAPMGRE